MISVKTLLFTVFGLYFIGFVFLLRDGYSQMKIPSFNNLVQSIRGEQTSNPVYRFQNPNLAYKVLSQLDVYKPLHDDVKYFAKSYLALKRDDQYCEKHRELFVQNPEIVFDQMNIVHSWATGHFVSNIVSSFASDLHSENTKQLKHRTGDSFIYDVKPETNIFFTSNPLGFFYDLGKHLSCLSQESNHIPGSGKLARRDVVAQAAMIYMTKYENKPHCLSYDKLFPYTWSLSDSVQCEAFFKNLNSPEYEELQKERKIVYIKKRPTAHGGVGVWPLHKEEEIKLRNDYGNGTLCGKVTENIIMQHYIHNSLLLDGHKFDFRMYMLIASVNPLIVYYHDGFLRVTLAKYDPNSTDNKVLLTNLALSRQIYDDTKKETLYEGMGGEDLKNAQNWSMERLQAYLMDAGIISDPNWLDNYLRPEFKKAMIHLVRLSSDGFAKHSSFYGLCGVDFMLDTNLNLWFIEANPSSSFHEYPQLITKFIAKMVKDHFEVVFGLLRSRMKRVVVYVNYLIENDIAYETVGGELVIEDLEERRQMFENITKNYFEKEFEVSKENGFVKIIDENEEDDVYQGLIEKDCL